jgi:ankyrin repeat protein
MDLLNKRRLRPRSKVSADAIHMIPTRDDVRFVDFLSLLQIGLRPNHTSSPTLHSPIRTHLNTMSSTFDAIIRGDLDALTAALYAGADPNATNACGDTLLMEAVNWIQLYMVNLLLSRGANVHHNTHEGKTALHVASRRWHSGVFPVIFSAAGPPAMNYMDRNGYTPLYFLARNGSPEQMAFALSHPCINIWTLEGIKISGHFWSALKSYGYQEARWQPMRYTWIKLLMIPTRR